MFSTAVDNDLVCVTVTGPARQCVTHPRWR